VHLTCGDHTLTLPDGRTLGYSVHGDPDGLPVVNCHGGLVSGHDVSPVHDVARALKVCVVSPDRPGRQPHRAARGSRRVAVGPSGPGTLLAHLGVGSIGVMGWSEGGQYALGAASELGERVTGCAVIAGCPPLDDRATFTQLNRLDRTFVRLARRAPIVLRC
jgi:pimeloyl-ACP methyl ester carboxylesterase